jgi:hypothetical protein
MESINHPQERRAALFQIEADSSLGTMIAKAISAIKAR